MDDFKIKSLDDFDSMFMSSKKAAAPKPAAPVTPQPQQQAPVYNPAPAAPVQQPAAQAKAQPAAKKESLIPEMETGPVEINFFDIDEAPAEASAAPAAPVASPAQKPVSNVYTAAPVTPANNAAAAGFGTAPQSVQPPVSLYQAEGMNDNGVSQFLYQPEKAKDDDDDEDFSEEESGGSGVLPMIGKVASIVMLALTLIIFVAGCFITIFLNNKDSKCGSICFATLTEDVSGLSGGKNDTITKGSLIVCKSTDINGYAKNDVVAVPTASEGCKLYQVVSVNKDTKLLTVADPSGTTATSQSCSPDDIYGLATYNFGGLGKVIQFASGNAILVCILFLLLAALWCLFIILIEKSQEKNNPQEDEEDTEEDNNGGLSF